MPRLDLRHLRDQALLTLWAVAGVAAATLAGTVHAPGAIDLSKPQVDVAAAGTPDWQATLAELTAAEGGARAEAHAAIRAEAARGGRPDLH